LYGARRRTTEISTEITVNDIPGKNARFDSVGKSDAELCTVTRVDTFFNTATGETFVFKGKSHVSRRMFYHYEKNYIIMKPYVQAITIGS